MPVPVRKPRIAPTNSKGAYLMHGGPYDGKRLNLRTPGTLEFSVDAIVSVMCALGPKYEKRHFTGYYDHSNQWVSTLKS